jgi:hypothetical protein
MKTRIISSLFCVLFMATFEFSYAQNNSDDKQAIKMIKEFYVEYYKVWENTPTSVPANVLHEKIDSFAQKYCTKEARNKAKERFAYGQDFLTKDYGIDSLGLKTLSISKDIKEKNSYIVSYTILDDVVPNVCKKEVKVIINAIVQKEKGILKIDDIK